MSLTQQIFAQGLVIATVAPDGITIDYFADSSSDLSSSDESSDPELQPQDKWACLRCKQKNQPIPRYCQHCFAVRKKWFPPRPAARKKRALHHTLTIPPQIQITPNLSIPDLSEMKGNPIADQVRRTYDEAIAKYASLSGEEQLAQLRERVRRHRLLRSHSDSQMAKLFNLAGPLSQDDSRVKSAILTKAKEHVITALSSKMPLYSEESSQDSSEAQPVADQPKQQTDPAVADDLEKVETQSRVSDASADTIPKELAKYKWPQRSKNTSDELDFREKVEAYLQQCNLPDTPPSSQPIETPGLDEDCVDGPRRPQEDCVDAPPKPTVAEDPPPTPSASSFSSVIQGCGKMCTFCEVNEANTAFIHNGKGHLCACYQCAKKVYAAKGQCPICQRQASNICKIYS